MTGDARPSALSAWLHPSTLLAVLGILGTAYAGFMIQRARIERLETRIEAVERDYQRQDVVRAQLDAIIQRLGSIERAVGERRQE